MQLLFGMLSCVPAAALSGFGLPYPPEAEVKSDLDNGALVEVLANWQHKFEDYNLYYPHRRHPSPTFALLVDALKRRVARP
jgi:DNA-binding transcriptional LysR family regulator